ncbi:MAG: YbjN domain-containing protein [Rhodobacterales bacterium]|nr:YbjN domain-containing protein [Rhodobacterales bacterium]
MSLRTDVFDPTLGQPLDLVERFVSANDWTFDRPNDQELAAQVPGRWCDYSLYFAWHEGVPAMHFTCAFDLRVQPEQRRAVHDLLAVVNERMWLGHFGLWTDEGLPMFRHAMMLRGVGGVSAEQMEDLVETAIDECDRFYPAFQYVVWGGKTAHEAVEAAMIDTVGEA